MKMKHIFILNLYFLSLYSVFCQTKEQPSVVVVPSDNWCINSGYYYMFTDPITGELIKMPDYTSAFQENDELSTVISKVGEIFSERGFPLQSLEQGLKTVREQQTIKSLASDGIGAKETLKERILTQVNADILLELFWKNTKTGPYNQITFRLTAYDSYTYEQIGASSGSGPRSSSSIDIMLEESILMNIDNLQSQMQSYFSDLNTNGRKVKLHFLVGAKSNINMQSECNGYTTARIIELASKKMALGGYAKVDQSTENKLLFDIIRIPMFKETKDPFGGGVIMESNNSQIFAEDVKKLITEFCPIIGQNKVSIFKRGLGMCYIFIGE